MVYQALLFSGDEKASRTVSQILNDLEFDVEVCAEPFAAVKQITNQHYDALVVDCDNEPNATLLFKSARNSSFNSACLAVALVQGQAGIAKAFRIGANLVLTKPIHVEQSKGTLRTAKGLLRKAEAAKTASTPAPATKFLEASLPALPAPPPLAAHTGFSASPVASGALELQEEEFPELGPADAALLESMPEPMPAKSSSAASGTQASTWQPSPKPAVEPMGIQTLAGSASAAAPARIDIPSAPDSIPDESTPEDLKRPSVAEKQSAPDSPLSRREAFAESTSAEDDAPLFGETLGLGAAQPPETGNRKNFWIAAVLVLASAGAINYGWPQFQPLLMGIPLVHKYFAPQQAPRPAVAPAPVPAAQPPASAQPISTSSGSEAQPGDPQTGASATSSSTSPASGNQLPAATGKSPDSAANSSSAGTDSGQQPLHLDPEAAAGLLREKVDPVYPSSALRQHVEGSVELQANIGKDGSTSNLKVLSGKPLLAKAAAAAVRQWKYQPYELNGQPTEVQTEITVDFKLPQP
jgi:protein TonB